MAHLEEDGSPYIPRSIFKMPIRSMDLNREKLEQGLCIIKSCSKCGHSFGVIIGG